MKICNYAKTDYNDRYIRAWTVLKAGTETRYLVALTDGSRIVGVPADSAIELQTSYAKIELPYAKLKRVEISQGKKQVVVELLNGDRISGALPLDRLRLKTLFGEVELSREHIAGISVIRRYLPVKDGERTVSGVNSGL